MTFENPVRRAVRATRPTRREVPTHLFSIGQAVRLKGGFGGPAWPTDIYHVTGMLPQRGNSPQYRIRNDDERHERVTTQDCLERVDVSRPGDGATLIERTFGHGEGTEAKQSRNQEAEAGKGSAQA